MMTGTRRLPAWAKTLVTSVSEMPAAHFATVLEVVGPRRAYGTSGCRTGRPGRRRPRCPWSGGSRAGRACAVLSVHEDDLGRRPREKDVHLAQLAHQVEALDEVAAGAGQRPGGGAAAGAAGGSSVSCQSAGSGWVKDRSPGRRRGGRGAGRRRRGRGKGWCRRSR